MRPGTRREATPGVIEYIAPARIFEDILADEEHRIDHLSAITRRGAIRLLGGLGAGSVLAACTTDAQPAPRALLVTPTPSTTGAPARTVAPAPSAPTYADLARSINGRLLRPGDSGYATAARLYNPRYDATSRPAAVLACDSAADVQAAIRFAAAASVPFAVRCGGHSYPGFSTSDGLIVDVTPMSAVTVDTASMTARIGSGARLIQVYQALAAAGVAIAAGTCPTVGISGHAMGGGVGLLTRDWGLTCDSITSIEVVTADGRLRTADAETNSDLFWALRGGGGGSFGAVTAFTFRVRPVPTVSTFYLDWPRSAAADVVAAWQRWIATADRRITSTCKLITKGTVTPLVAGGWAGPVSALDAQLAPLVAAVGTPSTRILHQHTYAQAMFAEAGCSTAQGAAGCVATALSPAQREQFAATSSIVNAPMSGTAITALVGVATRALANPAGLGEVGISLDDLGGAVRDLAAADTAFGHRDAFATIQYTATYGPAGRDPAPFDTLVRAARAAMVPHLGPGAYVNYGDAAIADYGTAYWGTNYARLQQVKRDVDPHGLFRFAQAVNPSG